MQYYLLLRRASTQRSRKCEMSSTDIMLVVLCFLACIVFACWTRILLRRRIELHSQTLDLLAKINEQLCESAIRDCLFAILNNANFPYGSYNIVSIGPRQLQLSLANGKMKQYRDAGLDKIISALCSSFGFQIMVVEDPSTT